MLDILDYKKLQRAFGGLGIGIISGSVVAYIATPNKLISILIFIFGLAILALGWLFNLYIEDFYEKVRINFKKKR